MFWGQWQMGVVASPGAVLCRPVARTVMSVRLPLDGFSSIMPGYLVPLGHGRCRGGLMECIVQEAVCGIIVRSHAVKGGAAECCLFCAGTAKRRGLFRVQSFEFYPGDFLAGHRY